MGLEGLDGLPAVGGLNDRVVLPQHVHQDRPVELGIIRKQYFFPIHQFPRPLCPPGQAVHVQKYAHAPA